MNAIRVRQFTGVILVCLMMISGALALTDDGNVIDNQARLTYVDPDTGLIVNVVSNVSSVSVAALHRFDLHSDRSAQSYGGRTVHFPHQLVNTGNVEDRYVLTLKNLDSDAYDLKLLALYHDLDGNGEADANEPLLAQIDSPVSQASLDDDAAASPLTESYVALTPELAPGEVLEIVASGLVPVAALDGTIIDIELAADSVNGEWPTQLNQDRIDIVGHALIEIAKTLSPGCEIGIYPGETVTYSIAYANAGDRSPAAALQFIDGVAHTGVVIVNDLPGNATLANHEQMLASQSESIVVVQTLTDDNRWISASQWDGVAPINRVGLFIPEGELSPGLGGTWQYDLVALNQPAGDAVITQSYIDINGDGRAEFQSNPVCNTLVILGAATSPSLSFVEPSVGLRQSGTAPEFSALDDLIEAGLYLLDNGNRGYDATQDGVYLQLELSALDPTRLLSDENGQRYVTVELSSEGTGDRLWVVMLETLRDSGVFRNLAPIRLSANTPGDNRFCPGGDDIPTQLQADFTVALADCVLHSKTNDRLLANFNDTLGSVVLADVAVVDPVSTVFDALTLEPVAGALVSFINASTGTVAADVLSGEPLTQLTDAQGHYQMPRLATQAGFYIEVRPPADYMFPSTAIAREFEGFQVGQYSFGLSGRDGIAESAAGIFVVARGEVVPAIDIPLDRVDINTQLLIEKRAMQTQVAPGEVVSYEIKVGNAGEGDLAAVSVNDNLPFGYRYVAGSASLDGVPLADPAGGSGPALIFALGEMAAGQNLVLRYVLVATAGAVDSDGINSAQAVADLGQGVELLSPISRARVKLVQSGVLSNQAAVFGKVYIDADCDRVQHSNDWPIGGVKIYLEDGTFALTDENGQYSLYGLNPGRHVMRIDPLSMPDGVTLKPLDTRNAADADSRFLDLSAGDFHRADFSASCPALDIEKIFAQIKERNRSISSDWLLREAERFNPTSTHSREKPGVLGIDTDGDLSNGILNGPDAGRTRSEIQRVEQPTPMSGVDTPLSTLEDAATAPDPKVAVKEITNEQAREGTWLWPLADTSLDGRFMAVVRAGIDPVLVVNGQAIAESQIGERIVNKREKAQIVAWYGVKLESGSNSIEIQGQDGFGNMRVLAKGDFKQPSQGARLVLRAKSDTLPADGGRSVLPLEITILDANEYPAQGVYFVTLENTDGQWVEEDIQHNEPGHQIKIVDGHGKVHLRSSDFTGTITVRAKTGVMGAQMRLVQTAALRPLFGIGTVDIGASWSRRDDGQFGPTDQADGLKKGLRHDSRLALFLKGRIRGHRHLTLSYDSEKSRDTDLLRDINPNAHYPIHGDASIRGYEAQSRSKLYAKVEKGKNSVMWGDYQTDANSTVEDLARVQRSLTGLNALYDNGQSRLQVFGARPDSRRRAEELPGNGTAMLFRLAGAPIVANSEIVEWIVRDRDNPGLVISTRTLSRFGDYVVDSITGQLKFSSIVPTFDEDGNPVFIRVSYDVEGDFQAHTVAGFRLQHTLVSDLKVGLNYTENTDSLEGNRVTGTFVEYKPGDQTSIVAGVARMSHFSGRRSGSAQRIAAEHGWKSGGQIHTRLSWARAQPGFDNPGASITADREELRLEHRHQINNTLRANLEGLSSEKLSAQDRRRSFGVTFEKVVDDWTLRAGTRRIDLATEEGKDAFNALLLGVDRRFTWRGRIGSAQAEYEQDAVDAGRHRVLFNSKLAVHDHVQLYGRYELQRGLGSFSSVTQDTENANFSIGLESDFLPSTKIYSEYRMRSAIDSRDLETASGIRGDYILSPGVLIKPALEIVNTVDGDNNNDAVAVSLGYSRTSNPNEKITGHTEFRHASDSRYYGLRASYAARVNLDWTALLREEFSRQDPEVGEMTMQHTFTAGLARRPRLDNRHHMLFLYSWKEERAPGDTADRSVHTLSTHHNYQASPDLVFSGRIGGKQQETHLVNTNLDTSALLVDSRVSWDLDRRWDADFRAGMLCTGDFDSQRLSFGLGLHYLVDRNLRLGLAYNFVGFDDEDLDPEGYNADGVRFGLQYKFNEDAFNWLKEEG